MCETHVLHLQHVCQKKKKKVMRNTYPLEAQNKKEKMLHTRS